MARLCLSFAFCSGLHSWSCRVELKFFCFDFWEGVTCCMVSWLKALMQSLLHKIPVTLCCLRVSWIEGINGSCLSIELVVKVPMIRLVLNEMHSSTRTAIRIDWTSVLVDLSAGDAHNMCVPCMLLNEQFLPSKQNKQNDGITATRENRFHVHTQKNRPNSFVAVNLVGFWPLISMAARDRESRTGVPSQHFARYAIVSVCSQVVSYPRAWFIIQTKWIRTKKRARHPERDRGNARKLRILICLGRNFPVILSSFRLRNPRVAFRSKFKPHFGGHLGTSCLLSLPWQTRHAKPTNVRQTFLRWHRHHLSRRVHSYESTRCSWRTWESWTRNRDRSLRSWETKKHSCAAKTGPWWSAAKRRIWFKTYTKVNQRKP